MIRQNPLAVAMVCALFTLALLCCWCSAWWFLGTRELQALKFEFQWMNQTSSTVQALANEALEYSKRNPAINPLLQQFDIKPKPAGTASPAPPQPAAPPTRR